MSSLRDAEELKLFELRETPETKSTQQSEETQEQVLEKYLNHKVALKLTSRFDFDDYVKHIMIDATILHSEMHVEKLLETGERFFISDALAKLIDSKDPKNQAKILSQFNWRESEPTALGAKLYQLRERCDVFTPNTLSLWFASKLVPKMAYDREAIPEAQLILLEELAFLFESSALLMRSRATLNLIRKGGLTIVDAVNKFHAQKGNRLKKLAGPRWLLTMLVSFAGLATGNTYLTAVTGVGNFVLTVVDP